jgi:Acyl-CoA carboxylase epsilon subunit
VTSAIEPHVRVLKGQPTAAQLAAVVAALAAVQQQAAQSAAADAPSYWNRPQMRRELPHGASAWQHSLRNR